MLRASCFSAGLFIGLWGLSFLAIDKLVMFQPQERDPGIRGMLAKQVVKVLRIPTQIFMPIIGVLCVIGSYSLGINIWNLYLMLPVGIISYFLIEMG